MSLCELVELICKHLHDMASRLLINWSQVRVLPGARFVYRGLLA